MLEWIIGLAIIAVIAGFLGFGGVASAAAGLAKILFYILLVGVVILLIAGLAIGF